MTSRSHSVDFFDTQFQRQANDGDLALNPFELLVLPHLSGRVLDFGCGMGNLCVAAAKRGCSVVALDGSHAAIQHLQDRARRESLDIIAVQADLRNYEVTEEFDTIVSIGLLMFFDCPTAVRSLTNLQLQVREGGLAIINVLIEGTTYMDMFDPVGHCLFSRSEMQQRFTGWEILFCEFSNFAVPQSRVKSFVTLAARRPRAPAALT